MRERYVFHLNSWRILFVDVLRQPLTPEAICEMAYLEDPKVFDRDAETRRSKARADLRGRTGWADEQIEGWRVMLERNVRHLKYGD